jgi:hypothetical protein
MTVPSTAPNFNVISEEFSDTAQYEYQNRQYLFGIGESRDTTGGSLEIPVIGNIDMQDRGFDSGDVATTPISSRAVLVPQRDFIAKSSVGYSNATLFAFDKMSAFAHAHGMGAARKEDKVKIDVIEAGTYTALVNTVPKKAATTANTGTGFNMDQITLGQSFLLNNGYDIRKNVYLCGNALAIRSLFNDVRFTDWDNNQNRPYNEGPENQFNSLMGMSVRELATVNENKITVASATGNETAIYMISGDAIYNGYNRRINSSVVAELANDRTVVVTSLTMGSTIVHQNGIIKIVVDQDPQFA